MNNIYEVLFYILLIVFVSQFIWNKYKRVGGLKMIIGRFCPLTWEQDNEMKNGGRDIITIGKHSKGYFSGTIKEYEEFMNSIFGKN